MKDDAGTECPEVSGKTVKTLKMYQNPVDGTEVQLDFTDGTTLSLCVSAMQRTEASLVVCGGPGEPELLHKYELDSTFG